MQKTRKLLVAFFTLLAVICIMAAVGLTASASDPKTYYVDEWYELKNALTEDEEANIYVTGDIEMYSSQAFYSVYVKGTKVLDLQGHTIKYDNCVGKDDSQFLDDSNHDVLFILNNGEKLTINDSSSGKTGKIHFDGHLGSAYDFVMPPIRDMFQVWGELTINGGTFECGHEKSNWVTALKINGKLFTGRLRQQVYGTMFRVCYYGKVTVNGGTFTSRGGAYIKDRDTNGSYRAYMLTTANHGKVEINGGTFYAKGGAEMFHRGDTDYYSDDINIAGGYFETSGIENVLINYLDIDAGTLQPGYLRIDSKMLAKNIESKVFIADSGLYTYKAGTLTNDFYVSKEKLAVLTALEFEAQSPAMPEGDTRDYLGMCNVAYNKVVSFKEKALPSAYQLMGFSLQSALIVRNSSNTIVYNDYKSGLKSYNFKNATPDTYTVTEQISLVYGGKVVSKLEHVFVIEMFKSCNHTYTTISNTATCTEAGIMTERCTSCGEEKKTNVEALEHLSLASDWTYNSTHHWYYCRRCYTPTLTEAHSWISSTNRTCSSCRYNDNCEWGNAMDTEHDENYHWWPCDTHGPDDYCPNNHQLERELHTVRTLENAGSLEHDPEIEYSCVNGYVCDGCGEYFGETGEHKWEQIPAREGGIKIATCTTSGYIKYRCYYNGKYDCKGNKITCSATKTVTIAALGHDFDYTTPDSNTATCTDDGVYTYTCTRARCTQTAIVNSPALGHSLVDWEVTTHATCTQDGVSKATCTNSGCTYYETMPISATGHSFDMAETTVAPNCTETGLNVAVCTADNCNETQEEIIPATGHSFEKVELTPATMSADGIMAHYKCSVCDVLALDDEGVYEITDPAIKKIASVELSETKFVYDGKNKNPKITVKDSKGDALTKNVDYKISVASNRIGIGKYTVKVTFIGAYSGTAKVYFYILPGNPATVKSAAQSTSAVKVAWSSVPGAAGYTLYYYNASKGGYVKINSTEGTSYTVKGLSAGTKYTFKVVAYGKTAAGKAYYSESYTLLSTATKTKTPALGVTSPSKGKITLSWINVSGETGYQLYYSTSKDGIFKKYANCKANSTGGNINKVTSGKTYYFKVRTYIKTDSGYVFSAWSDVKGVKVK